MSGRTAAPKGDASMRQGLLQSNGHHSSSAASYASAADSTAAAASAATTADPDAPLKASSGGDGNGGCCRGGFRAFRRSPTAVLIVVSLALFVDLFVYCVIIPVLPLYVEDRLHGSSSAIGALFACYAAGLLLTTPLSALWSDRMDSRRVPMLVGLATMAGSTILFALAHDLWELVLARLCQGASAAVSNTIGLAMLADVYPTSQLPTQLGIAMGMNGLGALIGPPIGGALYEHVSYDSVFYVCAGMAALDLLLRLVLIDDAAMREQRDKIRLAALAELEQQQQQQQKDGSSTTAGEWKKSTADTARTATAISAQPNGVVTLSHITVVPSPPPPPPPPSAPSASGPVPKPKVIGMLELASVPSIQATCVATLILSTIFTGIEPLLALHYNDAFDSSSALIGYSYFSIAIPYTLVSIFVAAPLQEGSATRAPVHPKLLIAGGFMLVALSLATLPLPHSLGVSLAPMALFGIGIGCAMTPPLGEIGAYLSATGNSHAFASGFALLNLGYAVGMFLGPLASGFMYNYAGFGPVMWCLAGLAAAAACMLLAVVRCERRQEARTRRMVVAASRGAPDSDGDSTTMMGAAAGENGHARLLGGGGGEEETEISLQRPPPGVIVASNSLSVSAAC